MKSLREPPLASNAIRAFMYLVSANEKRSVLNSEKRLFVAVPERL